MRGRRLVLAAALTGAAVAAGGVAYASIPGSDGVISACYLKSGSALKVIDSEKSCPKGETMLTWNQGGTPGADGSDGADGVSGYEIVTSDKIFAPDVTGSFGGLGADCPAGKKVLGGGLTFLDDQGSEIGTTAGVMIASSPKADGSGWSSVYNVTNTSIVAGVRAYATCAAMAP
jgi:hypothetical protein